MSFYREWEDRGYDDKFYLLQHQLLSRINAKRGEVGRDTKMMMVTLRGIVEVLTPAFFMLKVHFITSGTRVVKKIHPNRSCVYLFNKLKDKNIGEDIDKE